MLKLTAAQVRQVEETHFARFLKEMQVHLAAFAPLLHEQVGDDGVAAVVRHGVRSAEAAGMTRRGPVRLFLEMTTMFGAGFAGDPQYRVFAEILDLDLPEMERADLLGDAVAAYARAVTGPGNANLRAGCARLRELIELPDPESYPTEFDAMAAVFGEIFPQKLVHMGRRDFGRMTHRAKGAAMRIGAVERRSEWTLLGLMMFFGHGCIDDPQYYWIGTTLRGQGPAEPDARVAQVERKARIWLDRALQRQAEGAA